MMHGYQRNFGLLFLVKDTPFTVGIYDSETLRIDHNPSLQSYCETVRVARSGTCARVIVLSHACICVLHSF